MAVLADVHTHILPGIDDGSPDVETSLRMLEREAERGREKLVFTPADMFEKEDAETLKGSVTWLVPDAQKNQMEPILLRIGKNGESQRMPPSEGEEFGYVIAGSVLLMNGGKALRLRKGSSFCLHPRETHYLKNTGAADALVLWIVTPPSF